MSIEEILERLNKKENIDNIEDVKVSTIEIEGMKNYYFIYYSRIHFDWICYDWGDEVWTLEAPNGKSIK